MTATATKKKEETKEKEIDEMKKDEKQQLDGFTLEEFEAKPPTPDIRIQKKTTTIPVKKPNCQQWFKTHATLAILVHLILYKEDGEYYLVHPAMLPYFAGHAKLFKLYLGINFPSGNLFLYPVQQPDADGNQNSWHKSSEKVILAGMEKWIQQVPEKDVGGYSINEPSGNLIDIPFPEVDMKEVVYKAFKDKIIKDINHPVAKALLGM